MIALDTSLDPPNIADITYATDNEAAGKLDRRSTRRRNSDGKDAVIAMLDLYNDQVVSVDIQP